MKTMKCPYNKNITCAFLETIENINHYGCFECPHYIEYGDKEPPHQGAVFPFLIVGAIVIIILGLGYIVLQFFKK